MKKVIKYVIIDILRNKIVLGYTFLLLLISLCVFNLEDNMAKGLLTILNVVLIIVPMVSILFASIYIYNSAEFIELMVSQPLTRRKIWLGLFFSLSGSLALSFFVGVGIPLLLYESSVIGFTIIGVGLLLTIIFVAIAMQATVKVRDKAKGIGFAILLWLYFTLLFDGLVLFLLFQFADYPIEKGMVAVTLLNPVDIGRILVLLRMDVSALLGYSGAVFRNFFGTSAGTILTVVVLFAWILFPLWISTRRFNRKDL
jgi:Cu-processing system permease protein